MSSAPTTAESNAARARVAHALRALGHAIVSHEVADDVLEGLAVRTEAALREVDSGVRRSRSMETVQLHYEHAPEDGERVGHFSDCLGCGEANPFGMAATLRLNGDALVGEVILGAAFEGAPLRAHGGVVAALFDEVMGALVRVHQIPVFTGRLTVSYRAATPLHERVTFRATLRAQEGRRVWVDATAEASGVHVADAEGLFIVVPAERIGKLS